MFMKNQPRKKKRETGDEIGIFFENGKAARMSETLRDKRRKEQIFHFEQFNSVALWAFMCVYAIHPLQLYVQGVQKKNAMEIQQAVVHNKFSPKQFNF